MKPMIEKFQVDNSFDLSGKVALITGGGTGIGKACALGMADAGADIVLIGRREKPLKDVFAQIGKIGRRAQYYILDVRDLLSFRKCIDEVIKKFGKIDILLNNAGIVIEKPMEDVDEKIWDEIMDINLKGAFFAAQTVGRVMIKRGYGKIINTLSNCSFVAENGVGIYCASKGGLLLITRSLSLEWAKYGINVNAIAPAFISTPMNEPLKENKDFMECSLRRIPFNRMGQPKEVVGAAIYLASDSASFVNGHVLMVDGGYLAC